MKHLTLPILLLVTLGLTACDDGVEGAGKNIDNAIEDASDAVDDAVDDAADAVEDAADKLDD